MEKTRPRPSLQGVGKLAIRRTRDAENASSNLASLTITIGA